jgi:hypothetical protein
LRSIFPAVVLVAVTAATFLWKRHERRQWESRRISGGRKALVLNLVDRR